MNRKIILYGGGGHAKVVAECVEASNDSLIGFVDDNPEVRLFQFAHLGKYKSNLVPESSLIISIGNNELRKKISEIVNHTFANVIHPTALISHTSSHGLDCMIFHRAIVQAGTRIGSHVILNTASQVDHDCVIGDYVHVGPGSILCGDVTVEDGVFIGAGSTILPGKKIGKWSIVGAGTVVTKNVPDYSMVVGNPGVIKNSR